MATAMLAKEMLPGFWRDWIYPWVPQRFVADGIKSIFYMGGGAWNSASLALLITGCVGLVLMALAVFIPRRKTAVTHD
jgi:ABC-type multidrug transport system permease subunit